MPKLTVQQIRELAKKIIVESPSGIRYGELVRRVAQEHPETPKKTIHGSVWDLDTRFPDMIHKPSRGLYAPLQNRDIVPTPAVTEPVKSPKEEEFYEPFAD